MNRRLAALLSSALPLGGCASGSLGHFGRVRVENQPSSIAGTVTAQFLGTSALLVRDGRTTILADGFVSRPGEWRTAFWRIAPNEVRIDAVLRRVGVSTIDAVFASHSHYDHALDAPVIAKTTGAMLLGSESTANVGRGLGLPERQIDVVRDGETRRYGDFELTFIESEHGGGNPAPGDVRAPLRPPAHALRWKTGATWSVLIRHGETSLLVHGSAGYKRGALRNRRADVVYLGIGTSRWPRKGFIDTYWDEVVRRTGARRVILVHWDNFFRSLDKPLWPQSRERFEAMLSRISQRAAADCVDVVLPVLWEPTDPFADLHCR